MQGIFWNYFIKFKIVIMKIITIANNIEGNIDGIGKHARLLAEEFKKQGHSVTLVSAKSGMNKWLSLISLKMSIVFLRAIYLLLKQHYDVLTIEYPFREHNPIIILFHIVLYFIAKGRSTVVAFSMHEYDRVFILRRRIIDVFLHFSDVIFVSEEKYIKRFTTHQHKMFLRTIPNHIVCDKTNKLCNKNEFCYFGLISKAKAFSEMISAWEVFNSDNHARLHIISSSDIPHDILLPKSIDYHYDMSMEDAVEIMFNCAFSIVPVLPDIGLNNSSFVSSIQSGCIPIGKFSNELLNKDFIINCPSYELKDFVSALNTASKLSEDDFYTMSKKCVDFGKNFSIGKTAKQMIDGFKINVSNQHL